jgi:hypothetical protein
LLLALLRLAGDGIQGPVPGKHSSTTALHPTPTTLNKCSPYFIGGEKTDRIYCESGLRRLLLHDKGLSDLTRVLGRLSLFERLV